MRSGMAMLVLLAAVGACTQVREIERVDEVRPVPADAAAQARTVAYQMPDPASDDGAPRITILRGTACQLGSQRALRTSLFTMPGQDYANVFQDEFRRAGYRALDAVAHGTADAAVIPADFRIVAVLSDVKANICLPAADLGDIYDGKGEASMTVTWQLHPRGGRGPVYSTTQRGYARIDEAIPVVTRELLRAAFARAVNGLLADEGFRTALRAPRG